MMKLTLRLSPHALTGTLNTQAQHTKPEISVSIFITGIFLGMTDTMKELCLATLRIDGQAILGYYIAALKKESSVTCRQKLGEICPSDTNTMSPRGMGSPVVCV